MPHTLNIRALTPADSLAFQALRLRGLQECPEAFASSHEEEVGTPISEIERRLQPKTDSAIFGAFQESGLCALVGLQREGMAKLAHKSFVWGVYVAPEARGRGVGAQIMRHALSYAATVLGTRQVNLGVNTRNTAAVALYRSLGFIEYGLEPDYLLVNGVAHDEYQMVCHVAGAAWARPHRTPVVVTLAPMNPSAFAGYRDAAAAGYAGDNVTSGRWPKEGALQRSYDDFDESLPQGLATPDNFVCEIVSKSIGATVGIMWYAVVTKNGLKSVFVYDVEIKPEFRRHGYARAAFSALETLVNALGLSSIGLHVFGTNPGAQALYHSLGFRVTGINMLKQLGGRA